MAGVQLTQSSAKIVKRQQKNEIYSNKGPSPRSLMDSDPQNASEALD
jgi:hypothetical protein